uniref:NADH-ubiquinone oxidoreductase chain 2 n=1 Tax=Clavelina lepadiformis TaxID=159417 RepID=C6GCR3_CLALP|nr:NADH dehydrogenase subunit 2 [Clavelina lepadiformis]ACO40302.1 NADH dehydrogenase subunit 2 [Clavelina lepadiformis]
MFFFLFNGLLFFLAMASKTMFSMWVLMELVSLLVFMYLLFFFGDNMILKATLIMKYFFIQTISGGFIILFLITDYMYGFYDFMVLVFLLMKIGLFPVYGWILELYMGLSIEECFIVGVIPKIIPVLMVQLLDCSEFIFFFSILSVFFGAVNGLKFSDIRQIMGMSSVMNMGFMLMGACCSSMLFLLMLMTYFVSMLLFFFLLKNNNTQHLASSDDSKGNMFFLGFLLLGLTGLPITFFFFYKFFFIIFLFGEGYSVYMIFSLLLVSIINNIFYVRMMNMFLNVKGEFFYFYYFNQVGYFFSLLFFFVFFSSILIFFFF